MFKTVGETCLEAENSELKREIAFLKRKLGEDEPLDNPRFLGHDVKTRDTTLPHPPNFMVSRAAAWRVSDNEFGVPTMIGRTFGPDNKNLEMTFYCTPHPATAGDYINILGELHGRCLLQLAKMYASSGAQ